MRQPDDRLLVSDILENARLAIGVAERGTRSDFESNRVLQAAVQRFPEILGEAASKISDETRRALPEVPWREIIGMRNRLVHGYSSVDNDIIWEVVTTDLPPVVDVLTRFLR